MMKMKFWRIVLLAWPVLLCLALTLKGQQYKVNSPDQRIELQISVTDSVQWSVTYKQQRVIEQTTVALSMMDQPVSWSHASVIKDSASNVRDVITAVVPCKDRQILDEYNQLKIWFNSGLGVDFRVYNEGVAYRFVANRKDTLKILSEKMNLSFPEKTTAWFPREQQMVSHYERAYLYTSLDTVSPREFCSLPALFSAGQAVKVLFTEADLFDYPGMFLHGTLSDRVQPLFPKYVMETAPAAKGSDRNEVITKEAGFLAKTSGSRTFPWRVFIITDDDRLLVESNLVFQLSRPCALNETSWIKPGKVAWDWYNANNLTGVNFPSGINTATYKYYIDFASRYGLEYVILDEGWSKSTTQVMESDPNIDIPELVEYGRSKGVGIILWLLWKPLDDNMDQILSTFSRWGIKGIKVDFMQRTDQYMVNYYTRVAREAARYQLLVDFHGAYKPAGLSRAYPNVLSYEGVRGNEHNKWSNNASPEHNVTLPFTRMVAGPMDYTPGAMRNAQKSDFTISFNTPVSQGTRCHQVAMYIVYESPLQMLCDLPSLYLADAPVTRFIAGIPSTWDETRVLQGKVGDCIAVARRHGDTWYVGAMTDWSPREMEIDLSFLPAGDYEMEAMQDGVNAEKNAQDYRRELTPVSGQFRKNIHLAPGGGWAAVIRKKEPRWRITGDGTIAWNPRKGESHADHLEMSGEAVSAWIRYSVDSLCRPELSRTVVFPSFRLKPDDTHGSLMTEFSGQDLPRFFVNGTPLRPALIRGVMQAGVTESVQEVNLGGVMQITSRIERSYRRQVTDRLRLKRVLFPSVDKPALIEKYLFVNDDDHAVDLSMEYTRREMRTDTLQSTEGPHTIILYTLNDGVKRVQPGDSAEFSVVYQAVSAGEPLNQVDVAEELSRRRDRVEAITRPIEMVTPDPVLNTAFRFAKIRAGESIFRTKNGLVHSPGGLRYYAAIWANDQAEYSGPWFGFAGYAPGAEAAINAYNWFAEYMNKEYTPIPSSIIAGGTDIWNGAGDRGDAAMIAYGAARFALTYGDSGVAGKLWPLIEWCLEYCQRRVNQDGVVDSDSDELEGRFPAGTANLCTSSLYYDALVSAAFLCRELGKPREAAETYTRQATQLRASIERYFGAQVEGFDTYRYYRENDILRSWICIPLTVGLFDRKQGTIDALFSPRLWTENGLATQAGDKTFWDRSTLYALRGVFAAGETGKALNYLTRYSQRRLLGEHVPYPVEAWPEGNQRHLSAESALYCRIYTEGLFGIRPTGFRSFTLMPLLPPQWNEMALRNITAFGNTFDIEVQRVGQETRISIIRADQKTLIKKWDGKSPVEIRFDDAMRPSTGTPKN